MNQIDHVINDLLELPTCPNCHIGIVAEIDFALKQRQFAYKGRAWLTCSACKAMFQVDLNDHNKS